MPLISTTKTVYDHDFGNVVLKKIRRSKNIRLRIMPNGDLQITLPYFVNFDQAMSYAKSQSSWVLANKPTRKILSQGQHIGKYKIVFQQLRGVKPTGRIQGHEIIIKYPPGLHLSDEIVQSEAKKASLRALRKEAEEELPDRLRYLAELNGFYYKRVDVRILRSRWGSCNSEREIVLNIFLPMLDQDLIDYVLIHELAHTKELNHSKNFWDIVESILPDAKKTRKKLKSFKPYLFT